MEQGKTKRKKEKAMMHIKIYKKYILLIFILIEVFTGCIEASKKDAEFPWSINVPELSVRLVVNNSKVESGQYPECIMEVMNTSKQMILVRKDFALNGPAVYDKDRNAMPQRKALEVKSGEAEFYRLKPGAKVSVKAFPNYKIEYPGSYFLKFAIPPEWWGFEDPQNPGKMSPKIGEGTTAVSNEVKILVYSGEK